MALDIGIGDGCSLVPVQCEPSVVLNDDGYYWFLAPLFDRLAVETGQYVDLYGDATFFGTTLVALERLLAEARALIKAQPDEWDVHVGTQIMPMSTDLFTANDSRINGEWETTRELYKTVKRERFLKLITQWQRVTARAKELGRPIVCFGD